MYLDIIFFKTQKVEKLAEKEQQKLTKYLLPKQQ